MDIQQNIRITLLIDCDNVSHSIIEAVLKNLTTYGKVNIKHAHGNWNSTNLNGWKEKLHIRPIQQFAYTSGKNATDASIIIDAMDLLYSKTVVKLNDTHCEDTKDYRIKVYLSSENAPKEYKMAHTFDQKNQDREKE